MITKKDARIILFALDVLDNYENDEGIKVDRTKLYNKLYKIAGVKKK